MPCWKTNPSAPTSGTKSGDSAPACPAHSIEREVVLSSQLFFLCSQSTASLGTHFAIALSRIRSRGQSRNGYQDNWDHESLRAMINLNVETQHCCVSTRGLTQGLRNTKTFPSVIPTETGATQEARLSGGVPIASPTSCRIREFAQEPPPPSSRALYRKRSFVLSSQLLFLCSRPPPLIPINASLSGTHFAIRPRERMRLRARSEMGTTLRCNFQETKLPALTSIQRRRRVARLAYPEGERPGPQIRAVSRFGMGTRSRKGG